MASNPGKIRQLRQRAPRLIVIVLAIVGIGYISSALTRTRCENYVAKRIAAGPMKDTIFYVYHGDRPSEHIFRRIGADIVQYTTLPRPYDFQSVTWPEGDPVPYVDQGGRTAGVSQGGIPFPFIVTVDHSYMCASLDGEGATTYFLCLFGVRLKVAKDVHWVS